MKFLAICILIFVIVAGWQVGQMIDPDVTLIVIGFVFGTLAAIPVGLLMLVSQRRNERRDEWGGGGQRGGRRGEQYADYPPMVMLPPAQYQQQPSYPAQPQQAPNPYMVTGGGSFDDMPVPQQDRRFRLTGGR